LEGDDLIDKNDKSGFGEVKTLNSDVPTTFDYKDFNYYNYSLVECISLLHVAPRLRATGLPCIASPEIKSSGNTQQLGTENNRFIDL
jgi:hypothetical protein